VPNLTTMRLCLGTAIMGASLSYLGVRRADIGERSRYFESMQ
jgi:hypothetical protein